MIDYVYMIFVASRRLSTICYKEYREKPIGLVRLVKALKIAHNVNPKTSENLTRQAHHYVGAQLST